MSPAKAPPSLPVPNPITPFWRTELHPIDSHRTTPEIPETCDIAIIGAGFAGTSMAWYLLCDKEETKGQTKKPSIVMLEARNVCEGATGRNGGHIKPNAYRNSTRYRQLYGTENAAAIAALEAAHVPAVKDLVERENIDCDFQVTRSYDVILDDELAAATERDWNALCATRDDQPALATVQFTKGKDAERICGVKGARACFGFPAAHLWPYKLVTQLLQKCVDAGLNLQTNTPVYKVSDAVDEKGYWTVETPRGILKAKKIIYATNGYTQSVAPQYTGKIVPIKGICSRIVATKDSPVPAPFLPYTYLIRYAADYGDYLISRADGSIVVGGARHWFWHDKADYHNNVDDSTLIDKAKTHFDELMQRNYLGWDNVKTKTDRLWTGIMGYTSDSIPHVGRVPTKPSQFILAGFNGHGMPTIFLTAKGLARLVRDETNTAGFEASGLPMAFETTEARLASKLDEIESTVAEKQMLHVDESVRRFKREKGAKL